VGVTQYIGGHAVGALQDVPAMSFLPLQEISLARALRSGGYRTWHVGKWHLGGPATWPLRHGFDVNLGGCDWGHPPTYFSPYGCPTLADGLPGEYLTDRLTDEAIRLVEEHPRDRPFFLNLWHYAVHTPIQSPPDLVAKYEQKARDLGLDRQQAFTEGEPYPVWHKRHHRVSRRVVQSDPAYAAMLENLDTNVGRLLDALDRTGQAGNTVMVFASDNGGLATSEGSPTCNAPLTEGKGWNYEGGVRTPLLVSWPDGGWGGVGVSGGRVVGEPVTTPDLYPTILAAAGVPVPAEQQIDGVDLGPVLRAEPFRRGPIYWHYPHYSNQGGTPAASVREDDWKLVRFFEDERVELYHLGDDVSESLNRASEEPAVVDRLSRLLSEWLADVGALLPRPSPVAAFDDLPG
jgi:arylsulfatase A-like enzyme